MVRLRRLLFLESVSGFELAVVFSAILFSSLVSVLVADRVFLRAVVISLPFPGLQASLHAVPPSLLPAVVERVDVSGILGDIRGAFLREFGYSAWILLVVEAISVSMVAYPFYERVRVQLPVLVYRASSTPCRIYWWFVVLVLASSMPVVLALAITPILELWLNSIPVSANVVAGLAPYIVAVVFSPMLFSSIVVTSNRYDYSLLAVVVLTAGLYALRPPFQAVVLAALYVLVLVVICLYVDRARWVRR